MMVIGKRVENVQVDVSVNELIKGMEEYFGVSGALHPNPDTYWEWRPQGLVEMVDVSVHGSPHFVESGNVITDDRKQKAYILLRELRKLMEDENA